jgi:hypothetical protein
MGSLVWDKSNGVGDLGYDEAASQGNDKFIYFYAKPNSSDNTQLTIIASDNPPSVGPVGTTNWKYIWFDYVTAAGNLYPIKQTGRNRFDWSAAPYEFDSNSQAAFAWTSQSLKYIPPTAGSAELQIRVTRSSAQQWYYTVSGRSGDYHAQVHVPSSSSAMVGEVVANVPLFEAQTIYHELALGGGSGTADNINVRALGCIDEWIFTGEQITGAGSSLLQDTKPPQGTWATSTTISFGPFPGQPATICLTLQDNQQRTMVTSTWDKANGNGDLGYDETASQGNSKWLYFYVVPDSINDSQLTIVASDNTPDSGPAGYSNWKYVWSTYIDGSGNLAQYRQIGNKFLGAVSKIAFNPTTQAPFTLTSLDLSAHVPATANVVYGQGKVDSAASADGWQYWVAGTSTSKSYQHVQAYATTGGNFTEMVAMTVPLFTSQTVYHQLDRITGSGNAAYVEFTVLGWVDEWIDKDRICSGTVFGSGSSADVTPDTPPSDPTSYDDEFSADGTSNLGTQWTWEAAGAPTAGGESWGIAGGSMYWDVRADTNTPANWATETHVLTQPAPSAQDWEIAAKFNINLLDFLSYGHIGLWIEKDLISTPITSSERMYFDVQAFNRVIAVGGTAIENYKDDTQLTIYLKLHWNNTTGVATFTYSFDGIQYLDGNGSNTYTPGTWTPSRFGIFAWALSTSSSQKMRFSVPWFRRIA